jgi:hypothetical protein
MMDSNCHLNWLITQNRKEIRFFVLELKNDDQIESLEEQFIMKYCHRRNIIDPGAPKRK